MSTKIERVNIVPEDSLVINCCYSDEWSFQIVWSSGQEAPRISGPANSSYSEYKLTRDGIIRIVPE